LPNVFPDDLYAIFINVKIIVANKWKIANVYFIIRELKFTLE